MLEEANITGFAAHVFGAPGIVARGGISALHGRFVSWVFEASEDCPAALGLPTRGVNASAFAGGDHRDCTSWVIHEVANWMFWAST